MKTHKVLGVIIIFLCFSCKEKQWTTSFDKEAVKRESEAPVMVTGKESSIAKVWIDPETGHRVEKLIDREGENKSFYFHNNPFLPTKDKKGWLMVFYGSTPNGTQL
ncbi:hypothetical protein, partial [Flavobacterium sp. UBA6046]